MIIISSMMMEIVMSGVNDRKVSLLISRIIMSFCGV